MIRTGSRSRPIRCLIAAILALVAVAAATVAAQPRRDFDHLATGFALSGAHRSAPCESCHARGVFLGTPKSCEGCHGPGARIGATPLSASHVPTVEGCAQCHSTATFSGARFNHLVVVSGSCATCHNGMTA